MTCLQGLQQSLVPMPPLGVTPEWEGGNLEKGPKVTGRATPASVLCRGQVPQEETQGSIAGS